MKNEYIFLLIGTSDGGVFSPTGELKHKKYLTVY